MLFHFKIIHPVESGTRWRRKKCSGNFYDVIESILAVGGTATTFRSAAAIFVENGAIKMTLKRKGPLKNLLPKTQFK